MTQKKTTDEALARISANLERTEVEWEPTDPGDTVVGYVGAIELIETKNGVIPVVLVDTEDGSRVRVYAGRTRLRKQLVANKVQPGDAVGIRYEGEKQPRNGGRSYFDYRVDVVRIGERKPDEMLVETPDDGLVPGAVQAGQESDVWDDDKPEF